MQYDLDGTTESGSTLRRIARRSSESEGYPKIGLVENHVSILEMKLENIRMDDIKTSEKKENNEFMNFLSFDPDLCL